MTLLSHTHEAKDLMLMAYSLSNDREIEQYRNFLKKFPNYPLYNHELISFGRDENEELMYFILMDNGHPLVLMPLYIRKIIFNDVDTGYKDVCSPYGYSGPIFSKGWEKNMVNKFWDQMDEWYKKNKVVSEFIRFNIHENWKGYNGRIIPTLSNVRGEVLPEEKQWNNFKPKVRNNYRKSVSYGLKSKIYHKNINIEVIRQFHEIYTGTMERNQAGKQFFYGLDYLVNLINNNPSTCTIIIIYKDEIPISAELLLLSNTTINSFLGGTVEEYFYTRPNDFLKIEVLKWAREHSYHYYFLGGGRENNDSLYQYKKNFFPLDEDLIFYTGRKIIDLAEYNKLVNNNPYCKGCLHGNYFPLYRCRQYC